MARLDVPRSFAAFAHLPVGIARALLALILLAFALLWLGGFALTAVGQFLVVDDSPSRADAIVVLSGDGGARLELGVELHKRGYARTLVLTGAGQAGNPPAAEVMQRQAIALGVPPSAILLASRSTSTREDALYTRELMAHQRLESAILVTSPYHQRRASLTFARAFEGSGITVSSFPVRDGQWRPDNWWQSSSNLQLTIVELIKLFYYMLRGYV